jgi:putative restriction endonuclease
MCGIQLRLLDGAHILPVAEPNSTDETANGIALCTLHHRAYDRSLVTFDTEYRIHVNEDQVEQLRQANITGKLEEFRAMLRNGLHLPPEKRDRPKEEFVARANELRGWQF